jgi:hypothetical protein
MGPGASVRPQGGRLGEQRGLLDGFDGGEGARDILWTSLDDEVQHVRRFDRRTLQLPLERAGFLHRAYEVL